MQKPFTRASVGKGRASSLLNAFQPRLTICMASSASLIFVNSPTSAPAMNPDSLAERMMSARGCSACSSSRTRSNSSIASAESVLVEAPSLSKDSHARWSRSVSSFQCLYAVIICHPRLRGNDGSEGFHKHRAAEAAADADRSHPELASGPLEHVQQMQHDACSRRPDRVAERDCAAVHVQLFRVELAHRALEAQLLAAIFVFLPGREAAENLRGERLVDLPRVEVVEHQVVPLQDRRRRVHGAEAHLRRIEARPLRIDDAPGRLEMVALHRFLGRED